MKVILVILFVLLINPLFNNTHVTGYRINDTTVDFRLKNTDGNMVSLSNFSDSRGFIIAFTCNECPYSQFYEKRLIALDNEFAPQGYPVIAINPNDLI